MAAAVGVALVGIFVGLLLGLGLSFKSPNTQNVVTLIGAALGGAPIAFFPSSARNWWWVYPAGLIVGLLGSRFLGVWLDPANRSFTQRGTLFHGSGERVHSVNYTKPFENKPNLSFRPEDRHISRELLEERPDGFKVKISTGVFFFKKIYWRATGLRPKRPD